jgi:hypothetical protein
MVIFIPRPKITNQVYAAERVYSIREICDRAGIKLKVTGETTPPILLLPEPNAIALDTTGARIYVVDSRNLNLNQKEGWQTILEILAYGFLDYAARATVAKTVKELILPPQTMDDDFNRILQVSEELSQYYESIVFIGGIATYLHTVNSGQTHIAEASYDGDFYISLTDFADLRDMEEVIPNRRLNKHQMVKAGIEFDIYVEHNHRLPLSYESAFRHRVVLSNIPCVCLEHLLILKLEAYAGRYNSAKGRKDARDIVKVLGMLSKPNLNILKNYLTKDHKNLIDTTIKQTEIYQEISKNNPQLGKQVKAKAMQSWQEIRKEELEL